MTLKIAARKMPCFYRNAQDRSFLLEPIKSAITNHAYEKEHFVKVKSRSFDLMKYYVQNSNSSESPEEVVAQSQ